LFWEEDVSFVTSTWKVSREKTKQLASYTSAWDARRWVIGHIKWAIHKRLNPSIVQLPSGYVFSPQQEEAIFPSLQKVSVGIDIKRMVFEWYLT
jgi:hypothetical protein